MYYYVRLCVSHGWATSYHRQVSIKHNLYNTVEGAFLTQIKTWIRNHQGRIFTEGLSLSRTRLNLGPGNPIYKTHNSLNSKYTLGINGMFWARISTRHLTFRRSCFSVLSACVVFLAWSSSSCISDSCSWRSFISVRPWSLSAFTWTSLRNIHLLSWEKKVTRLNHVLKYTDHLTFWPALVT